MRTAPAILILIAASGCAAKPDPIAPAFTIKDTDGATIALESWFGTPILLEVFGVRCGSCRAMMPELLAYHDAFGKDGRVRMLSVDLGQRFDGLGARDAAEVRAWKSEHGAAWTHALDDEDHTVADLYPHVARPTIYLIAADRTIAATRSGHTPFESLRADTEAMLA